MKTPWLLLRLLYWRSYALALERQLEGEKLRNRAREDELITIPMRIMGLYGVATREGPAQPRDPLRRQMQRPRPVAASGWEALTDEERAEWPLFKADTDRDGTNVETARREFLQMIEFRRQGNDAEIM